MKNMCESLPFVPFRKKDMVWEPPLNTYPENDDFTANISGINRIYELRIEQMDKHWWWCCFYIDGVQIWDNNDNPAKNLSIAENQVVRALNKYRKNNY